MIKNKLNIDTTVAHYLSEYQRVEKSLPASSLETLQLQRQAALRQFSATGFPHTKHADWKYTSLTPLRKTPYKFLLEPEELDADTQDQLKQLPVGYRLVFVNGVFARHLSTLVLLPNNGIVAHFSNMLEYQPDHLFATWAPKLDLENSFTSLNTAFFQDGIYIYLPANTKLTSPIELLFISTGEQLGFIPLRNVIIAQENSHATIVEKYIQMQKNSSSYFTNVVTECFLAAHSHIQHYKYLAEGEQAIHIGNLYVEQAKNSQFSAYSFALSGQLIRSDIHVKLLEDHALCQLKGLYYAKGQQQIAHHTVIDHVSPYTSSEEYYKGIASDHGHAIFNGKLIIREQATKSCAHQLNKNLLLSKHAVINTKPQLELFTDDIQCTHGASIGQLDEEALYYLRTRGLNVTEANEILIRAFAQDILQQMPLFNSEDFLENFFKNTGI